MRARLLSSRMDRDALARALGSIPSGLFIVTVRLGDEANAFLASWVQQAGFEPPALTVAVRTGRPADRLLHAGARFAVNVVPAEKGPLLRHFGRGFEAGQDPYQGVAHHRGTTGVEVLDEALAVLECRVLGHASSGDHRVYVGAVEAAVFREGGEPAVHLRKNGLSY
jgi:3-hydroxy-9,10-secoandrosta-1,3,5(10)-triene-9,17-dione monooxygenase reductase component